MGIENFQDIRFRVYGLLLGIPVAILTLISGLNYSGFCFEEGRYLSDKERIRLIFDAINSQTSLPVLTVDRGTQYYDHLPYASFDDYLAENPDCCKINPGGWYDLPPPTLLDRISGEYSGKVIVINFKVRYLDENGELRMQNIKSESKSENCGEGST